MLTVKYSESINQEELPKVGPGFAFFSDLDPVFLIFLTVGSEFMSFSRSWDSDFGNYNPDPAWKTVKN